MTGLNVQPRLRGWLTALRELFTIEMYPACPICGHVTYIKAMPLHLSGHKADDPDVVAWRERRDREELANA